VRWQAGLSSLQRCGVRLWDGKHSRSSRVCRRLPPWVLQAVDTALSSKPVFFLCPSFAYLYFFIWVCFSNSSPGCQLCIYFLSAVSHGEAQRFSAGFPSENSVGGLSLGFVTPLLAQVVFSCPVIAAEVQPDPRDTGW